MLKSLFIVLVLLLSGCAIGSSDYGCKGVPEGATCLSATDVYQATEYTDHVGPDMSGDSPTYLPPTDPLQHQAASALRQLDLSEPIPIRTPEKVMRIWVAPWEDLQGNLHMPNYIYAEIEQRRWVVGEKTPNPTARLTPLEIRTRETKTETQNGKKDLSDFQPLINPTAKGQK